MTLLLYRSVEGEPTKVTWYKDNISIENNPDYQTTKIDNRCVLTIEETFVEDSAKFTCRAENDSGFAETSAYLSVKGTRICCQRREILKNSNCV